MTFRLSKRVQRVSLSANAAAKSRATDSVAEAGRRIARACAQLRGTA